MTRSRIKEVMDLLVTSPVLVFVLEYDPCSTGTELIHPLPLAKDFLTGPN